MIYHYTSIDTLALILETKKIRFNNLNDVDDITESEYYSKKSLPQLIYVSCWTKSAEENIALWDMYTKSKGVRIGLPDYPWQKKRLDRSRWIDSGIALIEYNTDYFQFSFDEIWNPKYYIFPSFFMPEIGGFETEVIYKTEEELFSIHKNIYKENILPNGECEMYIDTLQLGKYKDEKWAFQKEYRFRLVIIPIDQPYFFPCDISSFMLPATFKYVKDEHKSPIKDFFVDLDHKILLDAEIMIGPKCSKGEELIVRNLMKFYNLNNDPVKSTLKLRG